MSNTKPEENVISTDKIQVWRRDEFVSLGFTIPQAEVLADSKDTTTGWVVDKHKVIKALKSGCTVDQAFMIFS